MAKVSETRQVTYTLELNENEFWTVLLALSDSSDHEVRLAAEYARGANHMPNPPAGYKVTNPYHTLVRTVKGED